MTNYVSRATLNHTDPLTRFAHVSLVARTEVGQSGTIVMVCHTATPLAGLKPYHCDFFSQKYHASMSHDQYELQCILDYLNSSMLLGTRPKSETVPIVCHRVTLYNYLYYVTFFVLL